MRVVSGDKRDLYTSTYRTARIIATIISFAGWLAVAFGVLAFLVARSGEAGAAGFVLLPTSLGLIIGGLLLVGTGQITRATVDTADYNGEMLKIMKANQLSSAPQEPKQQENS